MELDSAFLKVVLNIFAGAIGGLTVNLFTNGLDLIQVLLLIVISIIIFSVIALENKKENKNEKDIININDNV